MNEPYHNDQAAPTDEGRRRYPWSDPRGYYLSPASEALPCHCIATCQRGCDGRCGCVACRIQFHVWADESGHYGSRPPEDLDRPIEEHPDYAAFMAAYALLWPPRPGHPEDFHDDA